MIDDNETLARTVSNFTISKALFLNSDAPEDGFVTVGKANICFWKIKEENHICVHESV